MKIILPLPTSINATYKTGNGRFYKSEKARIWEKEAMIAYLQQRDSSYYFDLGMPLYLGIKMFVKRDRDIDSGLKIILDFLQGRVYANDNQINHLEVQKFVDKDNPRVEISI